MTHRNSVSVSSCTGELFVSAGSEVQSERRKLQSTLHCRKPPVFSELRQSQSPGILWQRIRRTRMQCACTPRSSVKAKPKAVPRASVGAVWVLGLVVLQRTSTGRTGRRRCGRPEHRERSYNAAALSERSSVLLLPRSTSQPFARCRLPPSRLAFT